jgi:hypothetical protein
MDVEGAELGIIESSREFLRKNPIHFAFDSYHRLREGGLTCTPLERLFQSIDYAAESSAEFGQMYTWAAPPS